MRFHNKPNWISLLLFLSSLLALPIRVEAFPVSRRRNRSQRWCGARGRSRRGIRDRSRRQVGRDDGSVRATTSIVRVLAKSRQARQSDTG